MDRDELRRGIEESRYLIEEHLKELLDKALDSQAKDIYLKQLKAQQQMFGLLLELLEDGPPPTRADLFIAAQRIAEYTSAESLVLTHHVSTLRAWRTGASVLLGIPEAPPKPADYEPVPWSCLVRLDELEARVNHLEGTRRETPRTMADEG